MRRDMKCNIVILTRMFVCFFKGVQQQDVESSNFKKRKSQFLKKSKCVYKKSGQKFRPSSAAGGGGRCKNSCTLRKHRMLSSHPGDPGDEDPRDYDGRGRRCTVHVTIVMTRVD